MCASVSCNAGSIREFLGIFFFLSGCCRCPYFGRRWRLESCTRPPPPRRAQRMHPTLWLNFSRHFRPPFGTYFYSRLILFNIMEQYYTCLFFTVAHWGEGSTPATNIKTSTQCQMMSLTSCLALSSVHCDAILIPPLLGLNFSNCRSALT